MNPASIALGVILLIPVTLVAVMLLGWLLGWLLAINAIKCLAIPALLAGLGVW